MDIATLNPTEKTPLAKVSIKLGEIFEYEIPNEDEIDKVKAFFVLIGNKYYVINIDSDDNSFCFFDKIVGMNYNGGEREGKHSFNYKECLEYIKLKKVKSTGNFVIPPYKKEAVLPSKGNFLRKSSVITLDNFDVGYAGVNPWDDND